MFVFWKIWCALFSWNTYFEIHPFALLPTNCADRLIWKGLIQRMPVLNLMGLFYWRVGRGFGGGRNRSLVKEVTFHDHGSNFSYIINSIFISHTWRSHWQCLPWHLKALMYSSKILKSFSLPPVYLKFEFFLPSYQHYLFTKFWLLFQPPNSFFP